MTGPARLCEMGCSILRFIYHLCLKVNFAQFKNLLTFDISDVLHYIWPRIFSFCIFSCKNEESWQMKSKLKLSNSRSCILYSYTQTKTSLPLVPGGAGLKSAAPFSNSCSAATFTSSSSLVMSSSFLSQSLLNLSASFLESATPKNNKIKSYVH